MIVVFIPVAAAAALFEVAVRVWCRVAAGMEVVVEVFFEAGELG